MCPRYLMFCFRQTHARHRDLLFLVPFFGTAGETLCYISVSTLLRLYTGTRKWDQKHDTWQCSWGGPFGVERRWCFDLNCRSEAFKQSPKPGSRSLGDPIIHGWGGSKGFQQIWFQLVNINTGVEPVLLESVLVWPVKHESKKVSNNLQTLFKQRAKMCVSLKKYGRDFPTTFPQ